MPARARRIVDLTILDPHEGQVSRAWLRGVVRCCMAWAGPKEDWRLGVVIADDETVKRLNREYRGLDEVTDVLSFSSIREGHWEGEGEAPCRGEHDGPFVVPSDEPQHLGEVVISYPQALRQSAPGAEGLERELATLVVHGLLHMLGFDHASPPEEHEMQSREREILSRVLPKVVV